MSDGEPSVEGLILDKINALERNLTRRLDEQDAESREFKAEVYGRLRDIKTETSATNGRVTALERARERGVGAIASYRWVPFVIGPALATGLSLLAVALEGGFH